MVQHEAVELAVARRRPRSRRPAWPGSASAGGQPEQLLPLGLDRPHEAPACRDPVATTTRPGRPSSTAARARARRGAAAAGWRRRRKGSSNGSGVKSPTTTVPTTHSAAAQADRPPPGRRQAAVGEHEGDGDDAGEHRRPARVGPQHRPVAGRETAVVVEDDEAGVGLGQEAGAVEQGGAGQDQADRVARDSDPDQRADGGGGQHGDRAVTRAGRSSVLAAAPRRTPPRAATSTQAQPAAASVAMRLGRMPHGRAAGRPA